MAKTKRNLLAVLTALFAMVIAMLTLVSCGGKDVSVKFMVQENNEWKVQQEVTVEDGVVAIPEAPKKDYYNFAGWYLTKEGTGDEFTGKEVKESVEVYAKYVAEQVSITINGKDEGVQNLIDVVNNKYNPGEGLEFDGWYKDAACTEGNKWNGTESVNALYAKSVAVITINNGYEELYTVKVNPDEVFADPAEQKVTLEDGSETTLEENILRPYMSKYDLDYVDENGVVIDFTKSVTRSMDITVLWNTKGLNPTDVLPKSKDGHYYMQITSFDKTVKEAPVISIRNNVTYEDTKTVDGNKVTTTETKVVDYIRFYADCLPDTVKKIIIGDGVKVIQGMNGVAASSVEEIVLPNTLKIIDNSFNNMPNLKGVELPNGVEVVISSFFVDAAAHNSIHTLGKSNPNFEIAIPDSVKNLAMMPTNLKFSTTEDTAKVGDFYKGEDGRIYLNHKDGKVLIADSASFKGVYHDPLLGKVFPYAETIVVPEGVVGIQVGTYSAAFDYLILPSTFKFVNYNANMADYEEIYDIYHRGGTNEDGSTFIYDVSGNVLFDKAQFEKADLTQPKVSFTGMEEDAFAITKFVGGGKVFHPFDGSVIEQIGAGQIIFNAKEAPKGLELAFVVEKLDTIPMSQLLNNFVFNDDKNTVNVSCGYETADPFGMGAMITMNAFANIEGKTTITEADVKEALIAANPAIEAQFAGVTLEFYANNEKITLGEVKGDMYITVKLVKTEVKTAA